MANTLKQIVITNQAPQNAQRLVVQYVDDNKKNQQVIVNYESLTAQQKLDFDNFVLVCETIMNS
jgi:hypothetical protein